MDPSRQSPIRDQAGVPAHGRRSAGPRLARYLAIGAGISAALAVSVLLVVRDLRPGPSVPDDRQAASKEAFQEGQPSGAEHRVTTREAAEFLSGAIAELRESAPGDPAQRVAKQWEPVLKAGEPTAAIPERLELTNAQAERLRYVLLSHTIVQTELDDFPLKIGAAIPPEVKLTPLPREVADAVPAYEHYSYLIVQNRIVIATTRGRTINSLIEP